MIYLTSCIDCASYQLMKEIKVINNLSRYVRTNIVFVNVVTYRSQTDTSVLYKLIEARA